MLIKQVMEVFDVLDSSTVTGKDVENYLRGIKADANIEVYALKGPKGESTDMVKVRIPGTKGKMSGGSAPTIGLLGRLGGIGARAGDDRLCIRRRRRPGGHCHRGEASGHAEQGRLSGRRCLCLHADLPARAYGTP